MSSPQHDNVVRKSRSDYYLQHLGVFSSDVKEACRTALPTHEPPMVELQYHFDAKEIEELFLELGRFIMRHPDADAVYADLHARTTKERTS